MTTTTSRLSAHPPVRASGIPPAVLTWHRPLLVLAAAMAVLAVAAAVGLIVDPRELTGAPLWAKPLKFALSVFIYSVTLSWLIALLRRGRRIAWWAGTVIASFFVVEMVIIVGTAAAGVTSHFNVTTSLAATLFSIMGASIAIIWLASFVVAGALLFAPLGGGGRSIAIRAGFGLALAGMALGFLMTSPTAAQLADFQGIAGAHTVGLPDGGPGLPLLGWSTVAGDLRIPHFVGMHALQALPATALLLELATRAVPVLRSAAIRSRLIWVAVGGYTGALAILTAQALMGQSIVQPSGGILWASIGLAVATVGSAALVVLTPRAADSSATAPRLSSALVDGR